MKRFYTLLLSAYMLLIAGNAFSQCNVNTSICTPGTAGPFTFVTPGNSVSTCLDWIGPNTGYIILNITSPGTLNMLINGNSSSGYLDVAVFNIPNGVSPCTAIQSNSNQLGCNYASSSNGCNQFGTSFPCSSSVPAPNVVAGQTLMIVVENWSGNSSSFTLQLGTTPGSAGTGPPNAFIYPAGPFCASGSPYQMTAVNLGGTWTGTGISPTGIFNPATAGPGTHNITYAIGAAPCNSSYTTAVLVYSNGTLNVTPNQTVCAGGSTTLTASGADTYSWSPSTGLSSTTGAMVTASPPSTTTYTVTGTSNGCTATGTVTVTIGPSPAVTASNNGPLCLGEDLMLNAATSPGATFQWTGPNGFTSTEQNPVITGITDNNVGDYSVSIQVNGCTNSAMTTLGLNPNIYPVLTPAGPFCSNDQTVVLTADIQGGTWSGPGITNAAAGIFDPSQAQVGSNEITYTLSIPCGQSSTMQIVVNPQPQINFMADRLTGCSPLNVNFTDNSQPSSQSVAWSFGDGATSTGMGVQNHTYINVGCYDVTLTTTANNCTNSQLLPGFICVQPDPVANFMVPDYTASMFYPTFSFTNLSTGAATYAWTFGDGTGSNIVNPSHTYPEAAGSYEVELLAISSAGCRDSIRQVVHVQEEVVFYVPNAFTPDGDEFNNDFQPVFTSGFDPRSYTLIIYNRWGETLFQSHNAEVGWDGTYGGERCPAGTYVWTIWFKDTRSDKKYTYKGHVSIVK